uniref:hypothetical protein n=1 Tax=Alistipes sp. TaxID=1872444 RepID=UPI004056DCA8
MKKIKLLLVLPLVALLSCVKVINEDRYEQTGSNVGAWYVKNNTDNELKIVAYKHVGLWTTEVYDIWANPQDSTYVYVSVREVKSGKLPQFEDLLDIDSLYICDKDKVVLRKYLQKIRISKTEIFSEKICGNIMRTFKASTISLRIV